MRCPGFDTSSTTRRQRTKEGYLLVPGIIAASDNVQPYRASELKLKGMDGGKIVRVFRPKAEVDKSASAWDGKPVTLEHPSRMVDAKLWRTVTRGEAHNTHAVDSGLESDLLVKDATAADSIEKGEKAELSCAYDFELTMTPGISPRGEAYDAIASDYEPNHIAITGVARGGHICRVADSNLGDKKMRRIVFDAAMLGAVTGLSLELDDAVATQVEDSIKHIAAARDSAVAERDEVIQECQAKLDEQAAAHKTAMDTISEELPAKIAAEAADRASVLAGAEKLGITLTAEGKDTDTLRVEVLAEAGKDASRKAVMDAMLPDIGKATAEQLAMATNAIFALASAPVKKGDKASAHDSLGKALAGKKATTVANTSAPSGRSAMLAASTCAWKGAKK